LLSHHQWHFLIFQRMRKAFSRKSIWCCNMHQTAIRSFWIIFCSLVNGHQNDISLAAIPHFLWITIYNDVAMWGHSRHPSFAALSPHLAPAITVRKIMLYNCYPNIQWIWFYDILWSYPYQYHINIINNTRKPWPIMVHISLDQTLTVCVFMLHRCTVAPLHRDFCQNVGFHAGYQTGEVPIWPRKMHERPTSPNYAQLFFAGKAGLFAVETFSLLIQEFRVPRLMITKLWAHVLTGSAGRKIWQAFFSHCPKLDLVMSSTGCLWHQCWTSAKATLTQTTSCHSVTPMSNDSNVWWLQCLRTLVVVWLCILWWSIGLEDKSLFRPGFPDVSRIQLNYSA
jgi:hypothetical protein